MKRHADKRLHWGLRGESLGSVAAETRDRGGVSIAGSSLLEYAKPIMHQIHVIRRKSVYKNSETSCNRNQKGSASYVTATAITPNPTCNAHEPAVKLKPTETST